ncbi:MAG: serine hydroxymethyltransferase [Synechococcaceae bacterium WB8_1B_136]|nr:serine hydroxymethyltransferase [Synechococcaceae bacterium WB8_1B_136]
MEFLLYLSPQAKEILNQVYLAKYSVSENTGYCRSIKDLFGYADFGKKFVICTKNIVRSDLDLNTYINQTIYHEGVHVAHLCNGYKPFGLARKNMILPAFKLQGVKNSTKASTASTQIEHEAYWMEDKPEKVSYVIQKYCFR